MTVAIGSLACGPAVWGLLGWAMPDRGSAYDDYLWHPMHLSSSVEPVVGVVSAAVVALAAVAVVQAVKTNLTGPLGVRAAVAVALFCAYAGLMYRVATEPVIGANIGGGMLLLGLPVVAIVLTTWVGTFWWADRRRARSHRATGIRSG